MLCISFLLAVSHYAIVTSGTPQLEDGTVSDLLDTILPSTTAGSDTGTTSVDFLPLFAPPAFAPLPLRPSLSSSSNRGSLSLPSSNTPIPTSTTSSDHENATQVPIVIIYTTTTVTALRTTLSVTAVPSTVTEIVTVSPSSLSAPPTTATTPPVSVWSAPQTFTDLSAFGALTFAGGQHNLEIVIGIPADASASTVAATSEPTVVGPTSWDNSSSVMQLRYPANSINPSRRPQGGAEFYASPLDITEAQNVTLEYSVFFPNDFDWVLAGKLPGLYGGHTGCSGGDDALSCFSTRLMWRQGGAGELYLYAPKAKQTDELCSDPQSVCGAVYGFSLGRGSFRWQPGAWTNVRQTVVLNTPGKQDGSFTLEVGGRQAIYRGDIFYRDVGQMEPVVSAASDPDDFQSVVSEGTLLGPATHTQSSVLGPLLDGLFGRELLPVAPEQRPPLLPAPASFEDLPRSNDDAASAALLAGQQYMVLPGLVTTEHLVGFKGIFFSTFFGGHEPQYATPRYQYVWFKDFGLSVNS